MTGMTQTGERLLNIVEERGSLTSRDLCHGESQNQLWWNLRPDDAACFDLKWRRRKIADLMLVESNSIGSFSSMRDTLQCSTNTKASVCLTVQLDGDAEIAQGNDIIFVTHGDIYAWDPTQPIHGSHRSHRTNTIWMPFSLLTDCNLSTDWRMQKLPRDHPMKHALVYLISEIHHSISELDQYQLTNMTRAIGTILDGCINICEAKSKQLNDIFQLITELILRHIDDCELSIHLISSRLSVEKHLIEHACATHGTTFSKLLRELRLNHIRRLLSQREGFTPSLTEIAHRFGFFDLAHFSRSFKLHFGIAPSQYQRPFIRYH